MAKGRANEGDVVSGQREGANLEVSVGMYRRGWDMFS